ncbi:hypothetical protein SAMN05216323_100393 [Williamwhitmania taraxaci]|uniref:Uncharacterized protein n=1 Tax=Williamwhitmania taraxaci TaxID=1640674 RepID=A0A1G6GSD7_9BACT|nr:hypothetical protein SAMN05216323_100393 [Williamwhitmania taraxaci]
MIIITGVPDYFMLLCCGYKVLTVSNKRLRGDFFLLLFARLILGHNGKCEWQIRGLFR